MVDIWKEGHEPEIMGFWNEKNWCVARDFTWKLFTLLLLISFIFEPFQSLAYTKYAFIKFKNKQ